MADALAARTRRADVGAYGDVVLVCLLPVRNGEQDLPGYFESARRFADAVVALDDGSTDATRELLESEPLVVTVLTNPPRAGYAEWNDSENRNRLLDAAAALEPDWVISLDADERIDAGDAAALREFVATDAVRGDAYFLCVYRMIGGLEQYDEAHLWVGRMFAFEPGQAFPSTRHHFVALPTSIPTDRYRAVTIRIQHLAGLTSERRAARFEKYREADPDCAYQGTYEHLLDAPGHLKPWRTRSPHLPVVCNMPRPQTEAISADPALSVVVLAGDDEAWVEAALRGIDEQDVPGGSEIVLVTRGTRGAADLAHTVRPAAHVAVPASATPGTARNAGLRAAHGTYIAYTSPDLQLVPSGLAAIVRAHRTGYTMVTGTIDLADPTAFVQRARWFADSPPRDHRPGRLREPPPGCTSYLRDALADIGGFPEDLPAGADTVAAADLFGRGYSAVRDPDVQLVDRRLPPTAGAALAEQFRQGRAAARVQLTDAGEGRVTNARIKRFAARGLPGRLRRLVTDVRRVDAPAATRLAFAACSVPAATAWWLGGCYELARSRRTRRHAAGPIRTNS